MATETVVHDPRKRSMDAIQQRLQKDQLRQQQQQQQKNDKDKKGASDDANVSSSKQPLKAHSLPPTPLPKKPITKDPQDDGFAAYIKLSYPVDDKLLATNVKLSSGKKNIADKVLHTLLRSGDSAQKYLQGKNEKKVEENNYILLDNFVQSRSSGSTKASLMNSKRSKTRMSMKRLKKSGALNLPQDLQKFDLYKPMHGMWESYMMKLIKVTGKAQLTSTLLSADLHGAFMFVAECKIASFTGVQGIMIRETSQTFGIITREDKLRVVPKKPSVFIIQLDCWKITLHGDKFTSRDSVLQR
ncbi:ribonuclease P family protein [Raphanus sativus]|uniref:Ribonuclease MRP protein subunit POP4 n=1 Tax=Raphanus sativus TaxID=3726 RepID=A0A6J0JK17_RAPSA|nr:ribonuclease MRP protein subunit POP4 [Raphanus sativus]XP_018435185.1 ribonuclease MRP protein subunit POP4 [Raphanus sativus]KAJ4892223.1 ribonuclease P family protein [Raphanus sativus]